MEKLTLKNVEKLAAEILKDPAAKKLLETQFGKLLNHKSCDNSREAEFDKAYKDLKKQFKHGDFSDLGNSNDKGNS